MKKIAIIEKATNEQNGVRADKQAESVNK